MVVHDSPESDAAACDFLEMYDCDRRQRRARSLPEYQRRFPGHETRVAREFAALANGEAGADPGGGALAVTAADGSTRRIGRYRLLRELGRGGQAVVWLAHDETLDRNVALKLLTGAAGWLSVTRRDRLQREANVLARLDHPGICTIYEAEFTGDVPLLAMRHITGETLATRLQRAADQPDPASDRLLQARPDRAPQIAAALELGEKLARALHAAHESGVVHRDVKPQNIMLTEDDQPVLLDFGIARTEDGAAQRRTRDGEVFGSLAYMPPERISGGPEADRRGDVYALGVTLFECLTLCLPYEATTTAELIAAVAAGERRDVARLNRMIPRDLALVLEVALDPDPARRYPTALAFAEDLRRLRHHEPIAARPIGTALRARRWLRRHPVLGASASLVCVALVISAVLIAWLVEQQRGLLAWQEVIAAVSSTDHPTESLGRVLAAAPHLPEARLDGPLIELLTRSTTRLELDAARLGAPPTGEPFFRDDDARLSVPTIGGELVDVDVSSGALGARRDLHPDALVYLRVSADRRRLVSSGHDGRVRCFDAAAMTEVALPVAIATSNADVDAVLNPLARLPRLPVVAPTGDRLALLGFGFSGTLLGSVTGADGAHWRLDRPGQWAEGGVFSPDGRALVVRWRTDPTHQGADLVSVHASDSGDELARLDVQGQQAMCAAFDALGRRCAVAGDDGHIRLFDTGSWACTQKLRAGGEELVHVYWVGFAPHGNALVTAGFEGLTVWDLATGARVHRFTSPSGRPFHVAAWSDGGELLAAVAKDGSVRVFETATWQQVSQAHWSHRFPNAVVWSARGDQFAFQDGRGVQVVQLQAPAPELRPHRDAIVALRFFAAGDRVLTASRDATAAVVHLGTGRADPVLVHPAPVRQARLSADERRVVTACRDGGVRIWDLAATSAPPLELPPHQGGAVDAWFFAADRRVVSIGADGSVHIAAADDGRALSRPRGHTEACLCLQVDVALGLIATGGEDDRVVVHDFEGATVAVLDTLPAGVRPGLALEGDACALAFDHVHHRLVVANRRDALVAYDLDSWQPVWVEPRTQGQEYSKQLAVASDGSFYATAHSGVGDWTFIDPATMLPFDVGAGDFPSAIVSALRFSPDGRLLLVASRDDSVGLWDLARRERRLDLRGQHGGIRAADWSRAGDQVATGSQDGTLRAWPLQPLPFARRHYERLTGAPARK